MWFFLFFNLKFASSTLHKRLASKNSIKTRIATSGITKTLTTYPQVLNYLLRSHETNKNTEITKEKVTTFAQQSSKAPSQDVEELVAKSHWCGDFFEKRYLIEIFIEGLEKFKRQFMREYWSKRKTSSMHDLPFQSKSSLKLQGEQKLLPPCSTHSSMKQGRRISWQARGSKVNVTTLFDTGTVPTGYNSGAEPNMLAIKIAYTFDNHPMHHLPRAQPATLARVVCATTDGTGHQNDRSFRASSGVAYCFSKGWISKVLRLKHCNSQRTSSTFF